MLKINPNLEVKISSYEDRLYKSQIPIYEALLDWGIDRRSAAMLSVLEAYSPSGVDSEGLELYKLDVNENNKWKIDKIRQAVGNIPETLEVGTPNPDYSYNSMSNKEQGFENKERMRDRERTRNLDEGFIP